ncbi:SDH family Clp fold serine proteinase, partial [Deferrisoma sp.]
QQPAASILKVLEQKPAEKIDDQTLILADVAQKAIRQVRDSVKGLLQGKYPDEKVEELAEILSTGTWTHDHPITCDEARALGLNVSTELPQPVYELMGLFPQPVRRVPSVEYLPVPRHREGREGPGAKQ